jgi:hypothetical protein
VLNLAKAILLGFALTLLPLGASAQVPYTSFPTQPFSFAANGTVTINNIDGMSYCVVTVNSGSTMGSGTITLEVNADATTTYYAVSGAADMGVPGTVTQTITAAGKHITVPVSGESVLALVLSGATSPVITGNVHCNAAPGAAL